MKTESEFIEETWEKYVEETQKIYAPIIKNIIKKKLGIDVKLHNQKEEI